MAAAKHTERNDISQTEQSVRLDVWLWAARFFKQRSLAKAAIEKGQIRCNQIKPKPSRSVQLGDLLTIEKGHDVLIVEVLGISDKRGPYSEAKHLYVETADSIQRRQQQAQQRKLLNVSNPAPDTRPSKKQRRQIRQFKDHD